MDSYINTHFTEDDEIPIYFIRNKAFTKLHKALYDQSRTSIGVSFPSYKSKLGNILRLHGDKTALEALQQSNWLGGLSGYCEMTEILPIPKEIDGYRTVSRVQQNMTNSKLNRLIKRGAISNEEIKNYKSKMFASGLDNPYLELQSKSTGEKYRLYIALGDLLEHPVTGDFNHFGLSGSATIPWF